VAPRNPASQRGVRILTMPDLARPQGATAITSLCSCRSNGVDELRGAECHLHLGVLWNRTWARGYDGPNTVITHRFRPCMASGNGEPVVARSFLFWALGVVVADADICKMVSTGEARGKLIATRLLRVDSMLD
jgi:hypothetical protein